MPDVEQCDGVIVVPANFGEPRKPVEGAGVGETYELTCVDCDKVVSGGLIHTHSLGLDSHIFSHARTCPAGSFTLRRWH